MLTKPVRIDQSEGIPDPGLPKLEQPFVKLPKGILLLSLSTLFPYILLAVYCAAAQVTEHLKETSSGVAFHHGVVSPSRFMFSKPG